MADPADDCESGNADENEKDANGHEQRILEPAERHTGRRCVNMGLFAGLGLPFMFGEARDGLRPGDVVVLSPEYHFYLSEPLLHGQLTQWKPSYANGTRMQASLALIGFALGAAAWWHGHDWRWLVGALALLAA